jgi:hypothetical protein
MADAIGRPVQNHEYNRRSGLAKGGQERLDVLQALFA